MPRRSGGGYDVVPDVENSARLQRYVLDNQALEDKKRRETILLLTLILFIVFAFTQHATHQTKQQAKRQKQHNEYDVDNEKLVGKDEGFDDYKVVESSDLSVPTYRPCEFYSETKNLHMIQTSMTNPSAQLSELPCYRLKSKIDNDSTSYKASTAIIKTDFSKKPFDGDDSDESSSILGFGGAFTEASALNFKSLPKESQEKLLKLLFDSSPDDIGLGYTLGRTHMNSCDFSPKSYSFDDHDQDFLLEKFDTNVTHDVESGMIEFMTRASDVASKNLGGDDTMKIIASPWSPPSWMKLPLEYETGMEHSNTMNGSNEPTCFINGTKGEYAKTWALYFSKFVSAYKKHGIDLYGITVQNEPEFPAPWEACSYDSAHQKEFLETYLGPQMRKDHPDLKIFMFDHNKDHAPQWVDDILGSSDDGKEGKSPSQKYVDGVAIHWYAGGMDRLLDGAVGTPNMHRLKGQVSSSKSQKGKMILGSEACHCPSTGYAGGDLKVIWARAERYAHTVLSDLMCGSSGWIEWNLVLDAYGGPNHLGNMCDSPVLAIPYRAMSEEKRPTHYDQPWEAAHNPFGEVIGDTRTLEELNSMGVPAKFLKYGIVVQPMFFYMGHISRYVRPGSKPVMTLMDSPTKSSERAFRFSSQDEDEIINGGGINDLARNGIEITLWPCEGSTRQYWDYDDQSKQLKVYGHDWLGEPTMSCLSNKEDQSFEGLTLTSCEADDAAKIEITLDHHSKDGNVLVHFVLQGENRKCLQVQPLSNGGGAYGKRGGSQAIFGDCTVPSSKWVYDDKNGEIKSLYFSSSDASKEEEEEEVCLTTGWPFLQAAGFVYKEKQILIILNESGDAANYEWVDDKETLLSASIPPHSIQTIVLE